MRPGNVVDADSGAVLASHDGVHGFTIGQRKGLGLPGPAADGRPRYVTAIEPRTGTVTVGTAEDLRVFEIDAEGAVWTSSVAPYGPIECVAQVRAHGGTADAVGEAFGGGLRVRLREPLTGVARGQAVVLYRPDPAGDVVVGSGTIARHPMTSFVGRATGVGSWPGTDAREAAATVVGEVPDLAHLVELPARGLGADMIGRAGALLVDLNLDTTTRGYRIAARPSAVSRRAHDLLREDLDAIEEAWEIGGRVGDGSTVKLQVAGPLTLASEIELSGGHRVLTDPGAVRDLAASLAAGVAQHVAEVRRRLQADVVVQLDEPAALAVLEGSVRGVTGLDRVRAMPALDALDLLEAVIGGVNAPVAVHCCASSPPLELFRRSGAVAVGLDVSLLTARDLDGVGELLDSDKDLLLGLVPTADPGTRLEWKQVAEPAVVLVDRLGVGRTILRDRVGVTPTCGLAGASLTWARTALRLCRDVAQAFVNEPEKL